MKVCTILTLGIAVIALAACADPKHYWVHTGPSSRDFKADKYECMQDAAVAIDTFMWGPMYNSCLGARGWQLETEDEINKQRASAPTPHTSTPPASASGRPPAPSETHMFCEQGQKQYIDNCLTPYSTWHDGIPENQAPDAFSPPPVIVDVPLNRDRNGITLAASVNGANRVQFLLDTGASGVSLPRDLFDQLWAEGRITQADYQGEGSAVLADGRTVHGDRYLLRSLTVGKITAHNVLCSIGPAGSDPLLGLAFLNRFTSFSIRGNVLHLEA
jgi:clan AA aspartic protease (TIGR02281 family)